MASRALQGNPAPPERPATPEAQVPQVSGPRYVDISLHIGSTTLVGPYIIVNIVADACLSHGYHMLCMEACKTCPIMSGIIMRGGYDTGETGGTGFTGSSGSTGGTGATGELSSL